jgi:cytoskeletal protein RodZ
MRPRLLPHLAVTLTLLSASALAQALPANALEHAAVSQATQAPNSSASLLAGFLGWLGALWPDNSCSIDPNGVKHCTSDNAGSQAQPPRSPLGTIWHDNSCGLDPNGIRHCPTDSASSQAKSARPHLSTSR